ncbi:IclR family transcriptional regulator [Nocardia alni]|uniref:IclR family transcriptional regulator n=1 Tax=Nocardia alni TaxID=2815723 RepID=UPI001C237F6D|nr:IclR family transcriptional regulator [Nocardia alni]
MTTVSERQGANSVLGKIQLILDAFEPGDEPLSLTELSHRTGVAKSTMHRLTRDLVRWSVLERRGAHYRLGIRLFELGQRVSSRSILRDAARPHLRDLHRITGETVQLAVLDGLAVLCLDTASGQVPARAGVAARMPVHCTASGRTLLAFGSPWLLDEVLTLPMTRCTPRTVTAAGALTRELTRVRKSGYAVEYEQTRLGYLSVAIPLRGVTGATVGALSVTAPVHRADVPEYVRLLNGSGRRITREIVAIGHGGRVGAGR